MRKKLSREPSPWHIILTTIGFTDCQGDGRLRQNPGRVIKVVTKQPFIVIASRPMASRNDGVLTQPADPQRKQLKESRVKQHKKSDEELCKMRIDR